MGMMFGHKWSSSYGERDDGTWLSGLADLTPEQIGHGLTVIKDGAQEWPPTLPQFRNACRNEQAGLSHNTAAYKFHKARALPYKQSKAKGNEAVSKLKDLLK